MQSEWIPLLPLLILAASGTAVFCLGAFWPRRPTGLLLGIALLSSASAGFTAILSQPPQAVLFDMLSVDGYSRFYTALFSAITLISLLFVFQYSIRRNFAGDEFFGVMLFAAAGMVLIASAVHWLAFFLGLELLSISLYLLIAAPRGDKWANEAAVKYFIMGAVASAFLVFGTAMLYAASGRLDVAGSLAISANADNRQLILLGMSLILVGIGFKISLVPFHLWTPDVYQGAPSPITAFLATGSKVAIFSFLLRLMLASAENIGFFFFPVLWIAAAFNMLVGNFTALSQTRLKRLLAYSSIAHMGYLLMALLAVKQNGALAVMFYSAVYAVMDLGAFGTVGLLSSGENDLDDLEDYKGLGYRYPLKAALLTLCLLSLAGMPPTAGFLGKFMLFQAALGANLVTLTVGGILMAIVSLYFYLKVIVLLYMRTGEKEIAVPATDTYGTLACGLIFVLIFWFGLLPSPILNALSRIASFLQG